MCVCVHVRAFFAWQMLVTTGEFGIQVLGQGRASVGQVGASGRRRTPFIQGRTGQCLASRGKLWQFEWQVGGHGQTLVPGQILYRPRENP